MIFSLARPRIDLVIFSAKLLDIPLRQLEAEKRSETKPLHHAKKRGPKNPLFSDHSYTRMFSPQP